ncbi:MAG: hypothetical protein ACR2HF_08250 [Methylococcaceae bacterium]
MSANMLPFNIHLLIPTDEMVRGIPPITTLDTFEPSTKNFTSNGLFSTEIFGKVGDERRNRTFSYIRLNIGLMHPVVFKALKELKQLYGDILSGKGYAVWDQQLKDFVKSTPMDGRTGYQFFLSHYAEIEFEKRPSHQRMFNINLVEKYRTTPLIDKLVILPAGLRDYEYDEEGKPSEGEINKPYKRMLALAGMINPTTLKTNPEAVDALRFQMQEIFIEIYDYFRNLMEGKGKMILGKWASRKIFNSTRNVITALIQKVDELDSPRLMGQNETLIGLYQFLKSALPIVFFDLRTGFLSQVFQGPNTPAVLVDKKTLKSKLIEVESTVYDEWMTNEGLQKVINRFGEEELRHQVLELPEGYFGLIYKGPDGTFRIFQDIDELPAERDRAHVEPLSFCELLYTAIYERAPTLPGMVTRYPITGYGSIYPSFPHVKATVRTEVRTQLDAQWQKTDSVAPEFPIRGEGGVNSMSPALNKLGRLGADSD